MTDTALTNTHFSVLMSVYHREHPNNLDLCFKSLHEQTICPTEIILVLDGPIGDDLHEVINKWIKQELPIVPVPLDENKGLGIALAIGVEACSHELIMRMDTDDICENNRCEKQLLFLLNHPEITIVGSWIAEFDEVPDNIYGHRETPVEHDKIMQYMRKRNPLNHMTVAYRKSAIIKVGNYQPFDGFEDYYLWARLVAADHRFANIPEYLVRARAGRAVAGRRGGINYIKAEIAFYLTLKKMNIISWGNFFSITILRTTVRIMSLSVRNFIYTNLLRRNRQS